MTGAATFAAAGMDSSVGRGGGGALGASSLDGLVLQELIGRGSFGRVYRAAWRGTTVAVKTIVLPAAMSSDEKREKMVGGSGYAHTRHGRVLQCGCPRWVWLEAAALWCCCVVPWWLGS